LVSLGVRGRRGRKRVVLVALVCHLDGDKAVGSSLLNGGCRQGCQGEG
jgi:hypothetical protein